MSKPSGRPGSPIGDLPVMVKPPAFDNQSTTGFFGERSGAFFSSDCFGALLDGAEFRHQRTAASGTSAVLGNDDGHYGAWPPTPSEVCV